MYFLETDRLNLKYIESADFWDVASIFKDRRVMYMMGEVFTDNEIMVFIENNLKNYKKYGFGYFLAVDKQMHRPVGIIGLTSEIIKEEIINLVYVLRRDFWHKGYAKEGADAMIRYAFSDLDVEKIVSLIYFNNRAAVKTAESLNMIKEGSVLRDYKGIEVPYLIYAIKNEIK